MPLWYPKLYPIQYPKPLRLVLEMQGPPWGGLVLPLWGFLVLDRDGMAGFV